MELKDYLEKIEIKYKNLELYETAFTHSSFSNENKNSNNYERLEFVGDAILDLLVSIHLYNFTSSLEGEMTKLRAEKVCEEAENIYASKLGLNEFIKLGKGEKNPNEKVIADVFEALIAAIYLDLGLDSVTTFFEKNVVPYFSLAVFPDYKSILQEILQEKGPRIIKYKDFQVKDNFIAEIYLDDTIILGTGTGKSKAKAEINAAKDALSRRKE
ncbi:MAG: ribonuclease III [Acholeplasmatales bacterium]|jgi:ribonuclease-3|nr:ribonuclease III [Acholeplasmatales bacterium]